MAVIDTRLAEIENLDKQYRQLLMTNPAMAKQIKSRGLRLQAELDRELNPLIELCKPWRKS